MEINQFDNKPRKLRKIKRVKALSGQPASFGTPAKVNYAPAEEYKEDHLSDSYFDNNGSAESIRFVTEEELLPQQHRDTIPELLKNQTVIMLLITAALIGAIMMYAVKPTPHTTAPAGQGLEGVVLNKDVPSGRNRCGLVEPHQGCVLYIMNPKNQEVRGKDFYATAAKFTGRERFLIETGNMHYSTVRIKPGHFAQINIPPLS